MVWNMFSIQLGRSHQKTAGWWFGTWSSWLSIQLGIMIPTDFHSIIFQRVGQPPTSSVFKANIFCRTSVRTSVTRLHQAQHATVPGTSVVWQPRYGEASPGAQKNNELLGIRFHPNQWSMMGGPFIFWCGNVGIMFLFQRSMWLNLISSTPSRYWWPNQTGQDRHVSCRGGKSKMPTVHWGPTWPPRFAAEPEKLKARSPQESSSKFWCVFWAGNMHTMTPGNAWGKIWNKFQFWVNIL